VLYYNNRRPHQSIAQDSPLGSEVPSGEGAIEYRSVLGGIIRDYFREAAWPQIDFETPRDYSPRTRNWHHKMIFATIIIVYCPSQYIPP
jgi:hypothetical protein